MTQYRIRKFAALDSSAATVPALREEWVDPGALSAKAAGPGPQAAAPVANDDSYLTNDASTLSGSLFANDTPGDVPLQVTAVNGSTFAVDREIILASGARLIVHADGSFIYNPNGAFDLIPTTNDGFSYTIAGGDTASVTVTVADPGPIYGTDNGETINGTPDDDVIDALGGNDTVNGLGGDDSLTGGAGVDTLVGGLGNDTYHVDNPGDTVTELDGEGYDIVIATGDYQLGAGVYVEELVSDSGSSGNDLKGNELDNIIRGNALSNALYGFGGNDTLYGGNGAFDLLVGGTGNDVYHARWGDTIIELAGEGDDIVYVATSDAFVLSANARVETLASESTSTDTGVDLTGNGFDNLILGGVGHDRLTGGGGFDTLAGGAGNDVYFWDGVDLFVELAGGGTDIVVTAINYQLPENSNLENINAAPVLNGLTLVGNSADNEIVGNDGPCLMIGNGGNDHIVGQQNNDTLYGDDGNDLLEGRLGRDLMFGGAGDDVLLAGAGNDVLEGGTGVDALYGEGGDDTYYVTDSRTGAYEIAGDGRDVVYTGVDYQLRAGSSIEVLSAISQSATTALTLVGNELNQDIYGNAGANLLEGGGGVDYLIGLTGNDNYIVNGTTDHVVENAGEGRDVVYTRGDYVLDPSVSVEILSTVNQAATTAINLTGSTGDQEIYGNAGANVLDGGGGTDYMGGLGGNDTYFVNGAGDHVIEAVGGGSRDVVYARASYALEANQEVEVLSAASQSATTAMSLTGNNLANEIYGNNGANTINGGAGSDYLMGFGGADTFAFTTALGAGNVDQILDFAVVDDTIALDDAVFAGLAPGALAPGAFVNGTAALDADDRILYNSATGQILFDADGNGAGTAVLFATVTAGTALTASDFTVI